MIPLRVSTGEQRQLQHLLQHAASGRVCCRAQALLWLTRGESVPTVAARLQVSRQTLYNWMNHFEERQGLELNQRLADADRVGRPPTALGIIDPVVDQIIDQDPRDFGYHATRWTIPLLQYYLRVEHQLPVSGKSISRALKRLRVRWKRPRHQLGARPTTWRQAKGG